MVYGSSLNEWFTRENVRDADALTYVARLAEHSERYDDMAAAMKKLVELNLKLDDDGRNLFSVAFKNIIGTHRSSWRTVSAMCAKENAEESRAVTETRSRIEHDLENVCQEALDILQQTLIPNETSAEGQVFYYKMLGDYCRYLAEFRSGEKREESVKKSLEAYEEATKRANAALSETHPIRLGLALNFSVFHYEIMNNPEEACKLAKKAFDDAIRNMDVAAQESHKDSTLIMQLLRDNLTLWTSEQEPDK